MNDLYALIQHAAHSGAFGNNGIPAPSLASLKAGNYRKGRVSLYGLDIAIETPQGAPRTGKSDGQAWSVICQGHYGDISGTKGADGDPVDCYVGPTPESSLVFVVNQNGKDGSFDEHKVMLAYADEDAARTAYMHSYLPGWKGLGSLVLATVDQFKWWLKFGNTTQPFTKNALPYDGEDDMNEITWDSAAMPANSDLATILYDLRRDPDAALLLDAVSLADVLEDADSMEVLDALVVENAKLQLTMEKLGRIMEGSGGAVKPVSLQISDPFKQKGTTMVTALWELSDGQTVAIFFHNPDSTPNKILPHDELVSWKWLLNKKDVTILVAPEKGQDLNPREVARRIMKLAERNSAKFQKANADRATRMADLETAKQANAGKESALAQLDAEIADLSAQVEAMRNKQAPHPANPLPAVAHVEPEVAVAAEPETPPEPSPAPDNEVPSKSEWQSAVTQAIADKLSVGYGDAAGMVEAQDFYMTQSWGKGMGVDETADKIIAEATQAAAPAPEPSMYDKPMAAEGLTSYRYKNGAYGFIMIGATDDADALAQAQRSLSDGTAELGNLQVWSGSEYVDVKAPSPIEEPAAIEPAVDDQLLAARELLQAVIDGDADFDDLTLAQRLEAVHDQYSDNTEIMALFELAANAYSDAVIAKAKAALAA